MRSRLRLLVILCSLLLLPLTCGLSDATTFYVAPTGQAGCSTNTASPQGGLGNGIACLSAGDTLVLKNGTYASSVQNTIPSGTAGAYTTLIAENRRQAVIRPTGGLGGGHAIIMIGIDSIRTRIRLQSLVIDGGGTIAPAVGITIRPPNPTDNPTTDFIDIIDNEIRNIPGASAFDTTGDNSLGIALASGVSNLLIRSNYIHDVEFPFPPSGVQFLSYCIYQSGGSNSIIEDNELTRCSGYGIHGFNGSAGQNTIIRRNYIHDNGAMGILSCHSNNQIYNNLIIRNGGHPRDPGGIQLGGFCSGNIATGNQVDNNTIYGTSNYCFRMGNPGGGAPANNNFVRNNICWNNDGEDTIRVVSGSGNTISNNHCGTAGATGGCSTVGNPSFVDQNASDFHLASGSSAGTGGVNLAPRFTTDYEGNTRVDPWTRGAYCINCGSTPPPPTTPARIWLTFEEGSGTTVSDEMKNGNFGTFQGSTLPTFVPGRLGKFGVRLGTAGQLVVLSLAPLAAQFTIAVSLNADDPISGALVSRAFYTSYSGNGFPEVTLVWDHTATQFRKSFVIGEGNSVYNACQYASALTNGTWYRLLMTYDGANLRCYLNGNLENTIASAPPAGSMLEMTLNRRNETNFAGVLDEFIVDDHVWNSSEIMSDFNRNFNPPPIGPTQGGR